MSHYPSSAELAALRWGIHERMSPDHDADHCPLDVPRRMSGWPEGGAYRHERQGGIGYSGGSPTAPFLMHEADGGPFPMGYSVSCAWADAYDHSWARKVAGSMRSRAFATLDYGHPWDAGAWSGELYDGCPLPA